MPRKKSHRIKSQIMAARRRQETPEQRSERLEKSRIHSAVRRASETIEEREARLARDRVRMSATRRNLKKRVNCINLKLHLDQSLSDAVTESHLTNLCGRDLNDYKAYLRYNEQRKRAANNASIRRSQESPEQRSLRLEKCRIRTATIRACESIKERAFRLQQNRERVRDNRMQAKLQRVSKSAPHRLKKISKAQQDEPMHSPSPLLETKVNVINGINGTQPRFRGGFCPKTAGNYNSVQSPSPLWETKVNVINGINRIKPRFRCGFCPKVAGNYNSMMETLDVECDVEVEEGAESLESIEESMVIFKYFLPEMKNKLVTEKNHDRVNSVVESTSQLENPKNIADKIEDRHNPSDGIGVLQNLGLMPVAAESATNLPQM